MRSIFAAWERGDYSTVGWATADIDFDIQEVTEIDESSVLMTGVYHARGRASGVDIPGDVVWLYGLSEGKITSVRWFDSREDALRAVGLEE